MKKREPIELRKVKPERLSKRLTAAHSVLKAGRTRLYNALQVVSIDDISGTDEGKVLRRALWAILRHDLDAVLARIARLRNQVGAEESNVRTDRRLKELNVNPEEVLSRVDP